MGGRKFPLTLGGAGVGPINVINENNLHGFSLYGVEFYMLSVNINNMFESWHCPHVQSTEKCIKMTDVDQKNNSLKV